VAATTVDAAAGIVEEIWVGIVAPNVFVWLTPTVGVTCGFCCFQVTSNVASTIYGYDGLDCASLLHILRTISGSFFLLLKNMHNKDHKIYKQNEQITQNKRFFWIFRKQITKIVPPDVPICLPWFLVNKRWFLKTVERSTSKSLGILRLCLTESMNVLEVNQKV